MTETSMKEMFDRLVDGGVPPSVPLPVDHVLIHNGRLLRRRRLRRSLAAGLLAAIIAAGAFLLPQLPESGRAPPSGDAAAAGTPSPRSTGERASYAIDDSPSPLPATTEWGPAANRRRAEFMMKRLVTSVPGEYRLPQAGEESVSVGEADFVLRSVRWQRSQEAGLSPTTLAEAVLEVRLGRRAALLSARAVQLPSNSRLPTVWCEAKMDSREEYCRVVKARNGALARISGWDSAIGPTRKATIFYDATYVVVEQAARPRPGVFGLGRMVFTDQELAELAADPGYAP